MSALQQARRSRSKTAPDTGGDISLTNDSIKQILAEDDNTMAETLSALESPATLQQADNTLDEPKESYGDQSDNRSSSLSELGDGLDDHDEPTPRAQSSGDTLENDSEAETERLEDTPRKPFRSGTNTTLTTENIVERTPSKLANTFTVEEEGSGPPSPLAVVEDVAFAEMADGEADIHSISVVAGSETGSLTEVVGKKRKRSTPDAGSEDDDLQPDEPVRKRSDTGKEDVINGQIDTPDAMDQDEDEEADSLEKVPVPEALEEELVLQETVADVAEEAIDEMAAVAKAPPKARKGKRKGRKAEDAVDTYSESLVVNEGVDVGELNEVDNDEDEGSAQDEEVSKKRAAIDSLAKIERKFKIFRERWCEESLAQLNKELDMLKHSNCIHPEYLAMIQSVDERRAEKIEYEKRMLDYKQRNLDLKINAERHQMQSQYLQMVRDIREKMLSECNERIYQIQRGRRQLGVDETEYSFRFPEKRSTQIQQQTAYNLEVSILSGIAKYVGFPAAPEIAPARPSEIEDDLRAMKIPTRPAPPPLIRPYNRPSRADEAAAEEQFIEQTPWANPQHPITQSHYQGVGSAPSRNPSQTYQTPASQRRIVDVHAPNGSASTIEMISNPPSSAAAQGQSGLDSAQRNSESVSPVLQMKRNPSEQRVPLDTPGRNFGNVARDSYATNSSIGPSPVTEQGHEERDLSHGPGGARWSSANVRQSNAGTPSRLQERPEAGRAPLSQRSGLGPVSVGNASGLFGR